MAVECQYNNGAVDLDYADDSAGNMGCENPQQELEVYSTIGKSCCLYRECEELSFNENNLKFTNHFHFNSRCTNM
jgi:hypothetical protein